MPLDWDTARWDAFASRCKADLGFDPKEDGDLVAAERLGRREGPWESVWRRFAEAPALYPGVSDLLRMAMPNDLFVEPSSWPATNEKGEADLQRALLALGGGTRAGARQRVIELEQQHGARRDWVWAKLGQTPLADALEHLAVLAERTSNDLGGVSPAEMAKLYANGAWEIDAAALSSMAAVRSSVDTRAVNQALDAIYPTVAGVRGAPSAGPRGQGAPCQLPESGVGIRASRIRHGGSFSRTVSGSTWRNDWWSGFKRKAAERWACPAAGRLFLR